MTQKPGFLTHADFVAFYDGATHGPLTETGAYAFDAMVAWAEETGLPLRFKRDLYVHDRRAVMDLPSNEGPFPTAAEYGSAPNCFAWGVSESCTHLIWCHWTRNEPSTFDDGMGGALWHYFDGRTLRRGCIEHVTRHVRNWREYRDHMSRSGLSWTAVQS